MSRSILKSLNYNLQFYDKLLVKKKIKIWSRAALIPNFLIGKQVFVYSGNSFKKVFIFRERVGFSFGDFSYSKKYVSRLSNLKKKIKKK
jgi:ribosomal protein S19